MYDINDLVDRATVDFSSETGLAEVLVHDDYFIIRYEDDIVVYDEAFVQKIETSGILTDENKRTLFHLFYQVEQAMINDNRRIV